jgi:phosphotransferase system enzyme I (PtsI)
MKGLPVTIRTVDIGADKPLEGMTPSELRHESVLNPAWVCAPSAGACPSPACSASSCGRSCVPLCTARSSILIPMLATCARSARRSRHVDRARRQLVEAGKPFGEVELGAMIEVPAAALTLPVFLRHFDFVSIGTNDLIQYTLAIDRPTRRCPTSTTRGIRPCCGLIQTTITQARAAGRGVSVCGEMAGDPAFTELLLAMGLRQFSMHPTQIAAIKQRVLRVDTRRLAEHALLPHVLEADDCAALKCACATALLGRDPCTLTVPAEGSRSLARRPCAAIVTGAIVLQFALAQGQTSKRQSAAMSQKQSERPSA